MVHKAISLFLLAASALQALAYPATSSSVQLKINTPLQADSLLNIHLDYAPKATAEDLTITLAACDSDAATHEVGTINVTADYQPKKLIWHVPADVHGSEVCFQAWSGSELVGQSEPLVGTKKVSKRGHPEMAGMFFDAVEYHKKNLAKRKTVAAKDKKDIKIGIVGAGMSGLFSGYLLDNAGFHNYEIIEANDRLGGRVHTAYFGKPSDYTYQEMGPMRFPIEWVYENKTLPVKDHQIVFQLAGELNKLNKKSYAVEFIEWFQSNPNNLVYYNGKRLPNGLVPTTADVSANPSLTGNPSDLASQSDAATAPYLSEKWMKEIGDDIYKAHDLALKEGLDDWSEWGYIHNKMGASLNATEYYTGGDAGSQIFGTMYDDFTFASTKWRTIDGGLDRLPQAFGPVLGDKVTFNTKVTKIAYDGEKVSLQWKKKAFDTKYESKEFENVIVAVPFSVVRTWHLPQFSYTLGKAIRELGYSQACKVALEFKTRFWEHGDRPIHGGCSSTDLPAGSVCYPSYKIGAKGKGVMLSNYASGDMGLRLASMEEKEHVALILENMVEMHGEIARDQYTGNYNRRCWILDEFQSGSWAQPTSGQHKLFMPSYFNLEHNIAFVGEHTDVKHAWISAALESAIRGVVMLLVEHGHVDEAKDIVDKWNAKWMKI
ncbi:unnamed protein product [Umbelopsis ramanniana]